MDKLVELLVKVLGRGNKILIAANGGSATMSSHFAGELVGRFKRKRRGWPAISLTDAGMITAIANDLGYKEVFARQVEAYGQVGDVLIVLTTSDANTKTGHSLNLFRAIAQANHNGVTSVVVGSAKTKRLAKMASLFIPAEGEDTPTIQENQLKLIHQVCGRVEEEL